MKSEEHLTPTGILDSKQIHTIAWAMSAAQGGFIDEEFENVLSWVERAIFRFLSIQLVFEKKAVLHWDEDKQTVRFWALECAPHLQVTQPEAQS